MFINKGLIILNYNTITISKIIYISMIISLTWTISTWYRECLQTTYSGANKFVNIVDHVYNTIS